MKILITGATGFLGSAVLRLLIDEGYDVRVIPAGLRGVNLQIR